MLSGKQEETEGKKTLIFEYKHTWFKSEVRHSFGTLQNFLKLFTSYLRNQSMNRGNDACMG